MSAQQISSMRSLLALFFVGRKDKTLVKDTKITEKTEEHICLIQEPGSVYLGHTSPISGSEKYIFESIVTYRSENQIDLANLNIIGCDGTAVNTGSNSGVENYPELPLQHIICLLHLNLSLIHI